MPSKSHKIPKDEAVKLAKEFDKQKAVGKETIRDIPDGFLFDVKDVAELISNPKAVSFLIRFGWKVTDTEAPESKGILCPILVVLDENNRVIQRSGDDMLPSDPDEPGGGYLDESDPIPPPVVDFGG
ncbi:MAG: hypothetical protein MUE99_00680 [Chitinophagaceae bacterium]|jgi:hypothetical protein|nr:hypothetical protein [Chitinophagaceae bacterium]